jgi:hypothetical protein
MPTRVGDLGQTATEIFQKLLVKQAEVPTEDKLDDLELMLQTAAVCVASICATNFQQTVSSLRAPELGVTGRRRQPWLTKATRTRRPDPSFDGSQRPYRNSKGLIKVIARVRVCVCG